MRHLTVFATLAATLIAGPVVGSALACGPCPASQSSQTEPAETRPHPLRDRARTVRTTLSQLTFGIGFIGACAVDGVVCRVRDVCKHRSSEEPCGAFRQVEGWRIPGEP
jgi:hypothetical protein